MIKNLSHEVLNVEINFYYITNNNVIVTEFTQQDKCRDCTQNLNNSTIASIRCAMLLPPRISLDREISFPGVKEKPSFT